MNFKTRIAKLERRLALGDVKEIPIMFFIFVGPGGERGDGRKASCGDRKFVRHDDETVQAFEKRILRSYGGSIPPAPILMDPA
jgi:hypothetical protein